MSKTLNIGLDETARKTIVALLKPILADAVVLSTLLRNAHWNVVGIHFSPLHQLFGAQYDAVDGNVDDIAERIRALGHAAPGSLEEFLSLKSLNEFPGSERTGQDWLQAILEAHEAIIRNLRVAVDSIGTTHGDAGTADFLTGLLEQHEKAAWMVRAHVTNA